MCLEGLRGVEHLPHQIETVRRVLRHFRGRVLLADEVGLGKTIEACLLLREYLLRGIAKRVLILTPTTLVSQWSDELQSKFGLEFVIPPRTHIADWPDYWAQHDLVLTSINFAKMKQRAQAVAATPWDLVIVDEAHHCKNRRTLNWQLVNSLQRRHLFLLTATPVQNDLLELYNLLTLLEPGHLKTESHFKQQYVRRGNPRDPRNRERLRSLLGEVMIRNTRSLVHMDLPPRYAQTILAEPQGDEARVCDLLTDYLRSRKALPAAELSDAEERGETTLRRRAAPRRTRPSRRPAAIEPPAACGAVDRRGEPSAGPRAVARQHRRRRPSGHGHHRTGPPRRSLRERPAVTGSCAAKPQQQAAGVRHVPPHAGTFAAVAGTRRARVRHVLRRQALPRRTPQSRRFAIPRRSCSCSESGGEGRNLQFANTLVNFDLPWNPMRIEQRVGRIHRIGQEREVFIFNLCTAGSLEARILNLLNEKIRMFELVVGEVGSILGNLHGGEEFETLVLDLWLRSQSEDELSRAFDELSVSILDAQDKYVQAKELDEALFGEDYNE